MNNLLARIEASAEALVSKNEGAETILPYMHIHRFNTMNIPVPDPGEPFLYMVIRGRLVLAH